MNDLTHLHNIRAKELAKVIPFIPANSKVLEIGGGSGQQAKILQSYGFEVYSIDIKCSHYKKNSIFPIIPYNGKTLPFADNTFDIIFSSNVLEHIPDVGALLQEMQRTLKYSGKLIHIVPSGCWRIWTSLLHYPLLWKIAYIFVKNKGHYHSDVFNMEAISQSSFCGRVKKALFSPRHGEQGNVITEIYYFSKRYWDSCFQQNGLHIISYATNSLFYTGNLLFGYRISFRFRRLLSKFLGSSCHIYVLRKQQSK